MADIVAAGNHPALVSANPVTHEPFGMGSSEPLIPLHLDGELHRHYRKLLDPLFAPKRMTVLEDRFRELTDDIIDRFIDDAQVDFYREFAAVLPGTMFMQLFGAPMEDFQFYVEMKDRILEADGDMETRERRGREAGDLLRARLRELIDRRRADDTAHDDLIAAFMTLEIDGHRLSDDDIVNVMHLFVIAGLDTVTSSISLMISWLARHPDERRILIDDPSRVAPMVEELMRYESPVPSSGVRWAIEDTEINGIPVKQGDMVYLCWAAGNLDPAVFDDPHEVKLDRQGNRHIGRGSSCGARSTSGIDACPTTRSFRASSRATCSTACGRPSGYHWRSPSDDPEPAESSPPLTPAPPQLQFRSYARPAERSAPRA
jgi:cytochrome P450